MVNGISVRIEVIVGIIIFLMMVYIIFVNFEILFSMGMDCNVVFVVICLVVVLGLLVMVLWVNWFIGMVLGMGLNVFFVFIVVGVFGFIW